MKGSLDLFAPAIKLAFPQGKAAAFLDGLGHSQQFGRQPPWIALVWCSPGAKGEGIGPEFDKAEALNKVHVIRWIVTHQDHWWGVTTFNEQTGFVAGGEVEGPPQRFHSLLAGPIGRRTEQSFSHSIIFNDLEEAKDGHLFAQVPVGAMVNGGHNGAVCPGGRPEKAEPRRSGRRDCVPGLAGPVVRR